jgi:hypothetical protein
VIVLTFVAFARFVVKDFISQRDVFSDVRADEIRKR